MASKPQSEFLGGEQTLCDLCMHTLTLVPAGEMSGQLRTLTIQPDVGESSIGAA